MIMTLQSMSPPPLAHVQGVHCTLQCVQNLEIFFVASCRVYNYKTKCFYCTQIGEFKQK